MIKVFFFEWFYVQGALRRVSWSVCRRDGSGKREKACVWGALRGQRVLVCEWFAVVRLEWCVVRVEWCVVGVE